MSQEAPVTDFEALYRRYAPDVRRFVLYLCGNSAVADDITSETFIRAWTEREKLRVATIKGYLFTIARNLYLNSVRRTARYTDLDEALADGRPDSLAIAEGRSELRSVLQALQQLPGTARAALLMRAHDGLSYEEIAGVLGLSVAAVKVKVHRARVRLAQLRTGSEEVR